MGTKTLQKTKMIPYGKQWITPKDIQSVAKILASDWITQGPVVPKFENKFAKMVKAPWAVAVSSGTAGLHLACLAQKLKSSDEVLVPAITFVATANAVLYAGAKPRFVDIDPKTGNICPDDLEKKINKNSRGIIPVHFAGNPCAMGRILKIAKKHRLFVIEDACHALGSEYLGSPVGSGKDSDLTVFSFHPVKHITTGEGGMITGRSDKFKNTVLKLRNHGITRNQIEFINGSDGDWYYEQQELGFNYRITDFQAALGISQLEKLKGFVSRRRALALNYLRSFKDWDLVQCLEENPDGKSSYHLFVILLNLERLKTGRREIFNKLRQNGIGVQIHYIPLHYQPYFKKILGVQKGSLPGAEKFYERILTLPLYPQMSDAEQEKVIKTLKKILYEGRR